jgi:hypothetical protein
MRGIFALMVHIIIPGTIYVFCGFKVPYRILLGLIGSEYPLPLRIRAAPFAEDTAESRAIACGMPKLSAALSPSAVVFSLVTSSAIRKKYQWYQDRP